MNDPMEPHEQQDILYALLRAKVGDQLGLYYASGEGEIYENGFEECSGYVVTPQDHHYFFWTSWDSKKQRAWLETWEETAPIVDDDDFELLEARRAVGLVA